MNPKRYSIEYKGKWTTIRTCNGPVGAFKGVSGENIKGWEYLTKRDTLVNGCLVMCLDV